MYSFAIYLYEFHFFSFFKKISSIFVLITFIFTYAQTTTHTSIDFSDQKTNFFSKKILTKDLHYPWAVESLPCPNKKRTCPTKLILTEKKTGKILLWDQHGLTELANVKRYFPEIAFVGQGGLLDIAVSPNFLEDKKVFFTYSSVYRKNYKDNARLFVTVLAEGFLEIRDKRLLKMKNIFISKSVSEKKIHFGSRIAFDAQGYLYLSIGDRGERSKAQSLESHHGKILRLNRDASVPADNPFVNTKGTLPEIYTYGHRNVQGMIHVNGKIWINEHGPRGGDEINILERGKNYGWALVSHGLHYTGRPVGTGLSHKKDTVAPLLHWTPSIAPSGMLFYTGERIPFWKGSMFIGALAWKHLRRVEWKDVFTNPTLLGEEILLREDDSRVRDVTQSPSGKIYVITDSSKAMLLELDAAK